MNLSEFKFWFDGFTDHMKGPPSAEAWKKIKAKIESIKDDPPVTKEIFINDYYWPSTYRKIWRYNEAWMSRTRDSNIKLCASSLKLADQFFRTKDDHQIDQSPFDAKSAFRLLGKAEAKLLAR